MNDAQVGRSAWTRAQAKLNLRLHVLAREVSGYHSIETIFHRVEFGDDVKVTLAPFGTDTVVTTVDVGPMEDNLAYRAACYYRAERRWNTGFHIEIGKRIPAGGGMGGGSADAAATLRLLDALSPEPFGVRHRRLLAELGRQIGADVPFLLEDLPMALAWGHGDRLLLLPPLPQRHVALLFPSFTIGTAAAYATLSPQLSARGMGTAPGVLSPDLITVADLSHWSSKIVGHAKDWLYSNDFAAVISREHRGEVGNAMHCLGEAGAAFGGMTGSGSTLFGIFDQPPDAQALEAATGFLVVLTRTADAVEPVHLSH